MQGGRGADVKRFQWRVVGAVIAVAIVILLAAYLLRDVNRAGNTQQVQHAVGTSGAPNR
jgi:predicted small secreted protein